MTTIVPCSLGKPRPPLFRALGPAEPPAEIEIAGQRFQLETIFKHDSWAATTLYAMGERRIVCKMNRIQPIAGLPMAWLGTLLAKRELWFLQQLADLPGIPTVYENISAAGKRLPYAVAHDFIAGEPLRPYAPLTSEFFDELEQLVRAIHQRNIAYMDLHKRENVIFGADGKPYLMDFQVSLHVPGALCWGPARWMLEAFQNGDLHNVNKHRLFFLPDQYDREQFAASRPWWIRLHRLIAIPLRELRRRLLVLLGIRRGGGQVQTEHFVEDGLLPTTRLKND